MLLVLAACFLPANPTPWQLCQASWEVDCECGVYWATREGGDGSADWWCKQSADERCAHLDPDLCNPKSQSFDAEGCEELHELEQEPYLARWECEVRSMHAACDMDAFLACGEAAER